MISRQVIGIEHFQGEGTNDFEAKDRFLMDASKPIREYTVRIGPMASLPDVLRSFDQDPEPLLAAFGFRVRDFDNPDHRVPYLRTSKLLSACVDATGCGHLGLLLAQRSGPTHLGLAGFLAHAAPSVEQALGALMENLDLHDDGGSGTFEIQRDFCSLRYSVHLDDVSAMEQITDLSAGMMCGIMVYLCGSDWRPLTVHLTRREPSDRALYRRYFRSAVYYHAPETQVTFKYSCMVKPPPDSDELLFRHLQREARLLHDIQFDGTLADLPVIIRRCVLEGAATAQDVAEQVGLHERTLHRRLQEAGTNFRHELDDVRRTLSEQLLENTGMAVSEIANLLGYADASGFIRAFERWNGVSPNAWRKERVLR